MACSKNLLRLPYVYIYNIYIQLIIIYIKFRIIYIYNSKTTIIETKDEIKNKAKQQPQQQTAATYNENKTFT